MLVYTVLSVFAYGIYSFVTDTIRISQVSNVDKKLVELGTGASFIVHSLQSLITNSTHLKKHSQFKSFN